MKRLRQWWLDEKGFVVSSELVLVATTLVIGTIVGLVSARNQLVQELVDVGQAFGNLSQTYAYGGINKPGMAMTDGASFRDMVDFCQETTPQVAFTEPGGIIIAGNYPANAPQVPTNSEIGFMNTGGR